MHFTVQKSKCPCRFLETLKFCTLVQCVPAEPLTGGFLFAYFSLEIWDPLISKYSKKYKTPNIWQKREKKWKNSIRKRLGRGTLNTCANFRVYLSRTAWTSDSEGIGGYAWTSLNAFLVSFVLYLSFFLSFLDIHEKERGFISFSLVSLRLYAFFCLISGVFCFSPLASFCGVIRTRYADSSFILVTLFSSLWPHHLYVSRVNNQDAYWVCWVLMMSLGRKNGKTTTIWLVWYMIYVQGAP